MCLPRHSIKITPQNAESTQGGVGSIRGPELLDELIQRQADVLTWMGEEIAAVDVSAVTRDGAGRVIVADEAFARVLSDRASEVPAVEGPKRVRVVNGGWR